MFTQKNNITIAVIIVIVAFFLFFFFGIKAVASNSDAPTVVFQIDQGKGFRQIGAALFDDKLIRSRLAFDTFALLDGHAFDLKPGLYRLSPSMDVARIISLISGGGAGEVTVTIPEGSNIYDIDRILSNALVIHKGALIGYAGIGNLEGHLFPDTYQFYTNANIKDVIQEMTDNFATKAQPLLVADSANNSANAQKSLIIASILEKEVPDQTDRQIVAGIILKRLSLGIPLNIDATICYAKFQIQHAASCYPLSPLDFKVNSPYNTYLYKGLPPNPIGNPGASAIIAALHPQSSSYLYYLSDPKTGKTIFAKTLDEQNQNKVKYLESN